MLLNVLLISLVAHILGLVILGGITVVKYILPDDAQFEEAPVIEEIAAPKEIKVSIPKMAAPQQQPLSNLKMKQVGNISISTVKVDLPTMDESFTVSSGISGLGGGNTLGGARGSIGLGTSDVSIFGLKTRAEKLLFIIEADRRMVYDSKGGLHSYKIIKDEVADMVGNLSAGTLFNVMLVDQFYIKLFKPQLIPAGSEATADLARWLAPINNSVETVGIGPGAQRIQIQESLEKYPRIYAGLRRWPHQQAVEQVALEMNVDAVFMILGDHYGFGRIRMDLTKEERQKYDAEVAAMRTKINSDPKIVAMAKAYAAERIEMKQRIADAVATLNKKRAAKGQPPKVLTNHIENDAKTLGLKWKNPRPPQLPGEPMIWAESKQVRQYFHELTQKLYKDKGRQAPNMNVIIFLAGDENFSDQKEKDVEEFVRYFKGKKRIIRGLDEIKSAASSSQTKN